MSEGWKVVKSRIVDFDLMTFDVKTNRYASLWD